MGFLEIVGLCLLGFVFGLSCAVFFAAGFIARGRVNDGQKMVGRVKRLDPIRNTDKDVVDAERQERYEKGLDPYLNEDY